MPKHLSRFFFHALMFLGLFFGSSQLFAGTVVKVKGDRVYIKLDRDEVDSTFKGDILYLTTPSGKKKGLVVVKKMKGRLVIAQKTKGKARKSYLTRKKKIRKRKRKRPTDQIEDAGEIAEVETEPKGRSDIMLGVMTSFGSGTQNISEVVDMSGSTLGFKGIFDYNLFSGLGVQARLGMEQLSVSGSDGSNNFETSINYITVDLLLRYYVYRSESLGVFVNGGMGIYSPSSTDLSGGLNGDGAIQEDSISTTSLLVFGGGVSLPFSGWEIQLGAEYLYFPPSDDVDTSIINGKLALLFEL